MKVLGTPTKEEVDAMNPNYKTRKFPQVRPLPLEQVFPSTTP